MKTHKNIFIAFGLIIVLSSCRASSYDEEATKVVETESPSASDLITLGNQTATSSSIPTILPSQSPLGEPTLEHIITVHPNSTSDIASAALPVIPTIIQICPEGDVELPIERIGFGSVLRLLLVRAEDYSMRGTSGGLWVVSEAMPQPQLIPNTEPPPGWLYTIFGPSPDGHWIAISRYREDFAKSAWITSLDGREYWLLTEGDYLSTLPHWVTEHEMVGVGVPNSENRENLDWKDRMPLFTMDPFTMEERSLDPLPEEAIFHEYFTHEGISYAIYHFGLEYFSYWGLFNYEEKSSTPVFRWLVGRYDVYYGNTSIVLDPRFIENSIFHVYVGRDKGFDLSRNLTLDEIMVPQIYEEVMTPIIIPGEYDDIAIVGWINTSSVLVESTYWRDTQRYLKHLYILDYEAMTLTEYCLNDIRRPGIYISPDQRFLALTYEADDVPEKVLILDLETGYRTTLPGYDVVGWGVAETEQP